MCMRSVLSRGHAHMHALIVPLSLVLAFVARLSIIPSLPDYSSTTYSAYSCAHVRASYA